MDRSEQAKGKSSLTDAEIAAVRAVLESNKNERDAARALRISVPTLDKVLARRAVSEAMVTHLRTYLPKGESL